MKSGSPIDSVRTLLAARTVLLLLAAILLMGNGRPPWHTRRRPHPNPNRIARARVALADWPDEPGIPTTIDPARFTAALRTICGWMPRERGERYAGWILQYGEEFNVDPFLIAALVFREGRCRADAEEGDRSSGVGLTLLHVPMYWDTLRRGTLRYHIQVGEDEWEARERRLDRFPFNGPRLGQPEPNIYFAAALLDLWREQHESVDDGFEQHPHRHFVSHFVWGDRVRSDRPEDRILTDRRRLLEYYGDYDGATPIQWGGLTFGCPLDGCPRVISSWIGSERQGGARRHRGVDLESLPGEPVRAIAGGMVVFAGVDLPGGQSHQQLNRTSEYAAIARDSLGAGGRYVCLRHPREGMHSVRSCYMHMEDVAVRYGQHVEAGAQLGTVGRTGMRRSAAHLHLEISTEHLEDPSEILYGLLLGRRDADAH